jgi:Patatin-like phospholipase
MRAEISPEPPPGIRLDEIVRTEVQVINTRRGDLGRPPLTLHGTGAGSRVLDAVGLALSGGGIRSAAFSLGVLQSLNERGVLERVDYLSSVSGGGYMGSSLTATMTKTEGGFVFGTSTGPGSVAVAGTQPVPADVKDSGSVGHIRNYSNYLIPRGARDLVTAVAIVVRGLVANAALVLPFVLLLALITILVFPDRSDLTRSLAWLPVSHFGITLLIALIGLVLFLAWAIYRSLLPAAKQSEFRAWLPTIGATYLIVLAVSFFCELQPFVISGMFALTDASGDGDHSMLTAAVKWLATIATPIAAVVTFFRQQLGTLLKSVDRSSGIATKMMALVGKAAIWVAGAALPLLIWIAYLYLCYWGIINDATLASRETPRQPPAIQGSVQIEGPGINLRGTLDCRKIEGRDSCAAQPAAQAPAARGPGDHTPKWLIGTAQAVSNGVQAVGIRLPDRVAFRPVTVFYALVGILLFLLSYLLRPNANSLHQLYRDRLSKAFLFDPTQLARPRSGAREESQDQGRDFAPLDTMRISELVTPHPYAPYHLINAALNVQGSDYANRRGRNADFFLFSPCYVGSEATGYRETLPVESATHLDLATAMAISGAAFSSNMGANSIRPLTPTLAILNVRTGYWLKNPRFIESSTHDRRSSIRTPERMTKWYLWSEITGRLYEDSDYVYITDGGHIENLGIYELLHRRCRVIVAVDAEADPAMRFPSFIALQRYARIDLGVRITMPWDEIHKSTRAWMGFDPSRPNATPPTQSHGPHTAIGTIEYDGGETGWLLYIKSSLTGDEIDYVRDYARRYDQFPHETTGDQFFSEEQFEVYRALGFHIVHRLLNGDDTLQVVGEAGAQLHFRNTHPNIDPVRSALT